MCDNALWCAQLHERVGQIALVRLRAVELAGMSPAALAAYLHGPGLPTLQVCAHPKRMLPSTLHLHHPASL